MPAEQEMLSVRERAVLDFEGSWWLFPQPKDRAIAEYVGMSSTRYYQVLRRLVDAQPACDYAPLTVHRMRRLRRTRLAQVAAQVGDGDETS